MYYLKAGFKILWTEIALLEDTWVSRCDSQHLPRIRSNIYYESNIYYYVKTEGCLSSARVTLH